MAIDGDRLGDRNRAVAGGVEAVDFAICWSFRDCARESLAWGRAATRVCVVAYAGYPCAHSLRACLAHRERQQDRCKEHPKKFRHFNSPLNNNGRDLRSEAES